MTYDTQSAVTIGGKSKRPSSLDDFYLNRTLASVHSRVKLTFSMKNKPHRGMITASDPLADPIVVVRSHYIKILFLHSEGRF